MPDAAAASARPRRRAPARPPLRNVPASRSRSSASRAVAARGSPASAAARLAALAAKNAAHSASAGSTCGSSSQTDLGRLRRAPASRLAPGRHDRGGGAQRGQVRADVAGPRIALGVRLGQPVPRGAQQAQRRRRHPVGQTALRCGWALPPPSAVLIMVITPSGDAPKSVVSRLGSAARSGVTRRPGEALPHAPPGRHRPPGVAAAGANPRYSNTVSFEHRFAQKSSRPFAYEFEATPGV